MVSTLKMTFGLDNEKSKTISLRDPKDDVTGEAVRNVMNDMVAKQAISDNGAVIDQAKSAYVEKVEKISLF